MYHQTMKKTYPESRCCLGQPVNFRWFGYPPAEPNTDIYVAREKFLEVLKSDNRLVNEHIKAMATAEFDHKIKLAQ